MWCKTVRGAISSQMWQCRHKHTHTHTHRHTHTQVIFILLILPALTGQCHCWLASPAEQTLPHLCLLTTPVSLDHTCVCWPHLCLLKNKELWRHGRLSVHKGSFNHFRYELWPSINPTAVFYNASTASHEKSQQCGVCRCDHQLPTQ